MGSAEQLGEDGERSARDRGWKESGKGRGRAGGWEEAGGVGKETRREESRELTGRVRGECNLNIRKMGSCNGQEILIYL